MWLPNSPNKQNFQNFDLSMCEESDDDLVTILTLNCASAGQLVGAYLADTLFKEKRPCRTLPFQVEMFIKPSVAV